jgi:4-diphosphocytidyl-2-C-methyl-D-erythritol kinase
MVKLLVERTPAKINVFLRVTGRRADGYHELDSVFLPISLHDRVAVEIRNIGATRSAAVAITCNLAELPDDDRNLAVRAARTFMRDYGVAAEVLVDLEKNIPLGAGLGGGSSDAAAVLRMMAALFRFAADERLARVAVAIGADVPFFLAPRPARIGGIGEKITPLDGVPSFPIVLAVPPFEVATAAVFRALKPENWSGAAPDAHLAALRDGLIEPSIAVNDLAAPACAMFPEIARLRSMLTGLGARAAQMSGSGGAVFGVFASGAEARAAASEVSRRAPEARVLTCDTIASGEALG